MDLDTIWYINVRAAEYCAEFSSTKRDIIEFIVNNIIYICSEPFTRRPNSLDGPCPFARQLIERTGLAHVLDKKKSNEWE